MPPETQACVYTHGRTVHTCTGCVFMSTLWVSTQQLVPYVGRKPYSAECSVHGLVGGRLRDRVRGRACPEPGARPGRGRAAHPLAVGLPGLVHKLLLLLDLALHHPELGEVLIVLQGLLAELLRSRDVPQHPLQLHRLHEHLRGQTASARLWCRAWAGPAPSWRSPDRELALNAVSYLLGQARATHMNAF